MPGPVPPVLEKAANLPAGATTSTRGILAPAEAARRFALERRSPPAALAERVERHWITRWDLRGQPDHVQQVLPHPCVNLVVHDGIVGVYGVAAVRDVRRLRGRGQAVGTKFRPGAFAALTPVAMVDLNARPQRLVEVFGRDGAALERRLLALDPAGPGPLLAELEAFLAPRLPGEDPAYALVRAVAADMLRRASETRVEALARDHGVSSRTLQRLFRSLIGVGPKWVLRRYRVHEAAERLADPDPPSLARLAQELGYADQAHLSREFRNAVGVAPAAYLRGAPPPR
ncbi:helix-turn-helix domain-containing protein [Patulibacter defluvii]|uniref:helix-turn-helix domain-containing protein n=1 Tax=Patulibacter defluvii TaxID=3095358 RepID=UPI002A74C40B|nr:AraC family transcriptional regulator [Patulibacter sp. DM4]